MREELKKSAVEELQDLASDLKDVMNEEALSNHPKVKALRHQLDDWGVQAKDVVKEATEKTKWAAKVADDYAHEEPWRLIGAGVAVGVVIGILLGRR
ncbi:MAG: DUF883 family protein [Saezia sp.]